MAADKPELLAPAGSRETLEAAVRCGADAVYLGAREMSARRNAENFAAEELADAAAYCHIRGVGVYLTLNILLRDEELPAALALTRTAVRAGIDGIIIQDIGLAQLIRQAFPSLPLHASTQMSVHSPAALSFLHDQGFCRVVAAREMSAAQLRTLCDAAQTLGMTVEVFVHGALCMSVSGQCLLSAILGGRSGNRGLCAGPCRLPFSAPGGTGYDLSLKDLSLLGHLAELEELGVASLKIEGRMKRPEYVAAATAACRAALDTGKVPEELGRTLRDVFSRSGFTDGYFTGKTGREMFGTRTKEDVTAAEKAFPALHELYRGERQHIAVSLTAAFRAGIPAALTLSDGSRTVTVTGETPEPAKSRALTAESAAESLSKLGGTPYFAERTDIQTDDGLFLRGAALNALRRDAAAALSEKRAEPQIRPENPVSFSSETAVHAERPALIARFDTAAQIPASVEGLSAILLPAEAPLPESLPRGVRLIADVPRGIADEQVLAGRLAECRERGFEAAYCGNLSAAVLAKKAGLAVMAGVGLNVYNRESAAVLAGFGAAAVTLSAECRLADAVSLPVSVPKGIFAYGRLPLMLTRNCPAANGQSCASCGRHAALTDRKGVSFPVRCRGGFSELLNSVPVWLGDRLNETQGLDFLLLWFTDENEADVRLITDAYRFGGTPPAGGFTRGLYFRETL